MDVDAEVRFKIPRGVHLRWNSCAEARGLSLRAFIISTVSAYLVGTGELDLPTGVTKPAPKSAAKSKPITKVISDAPDCLSFEEMIEMGIKIPSDVAAAWGDDDEEELDWGETCS